MNIDLPEQCKNWGHDGLGDLSLGLEYGLRLGSVQSRKGEVDCINDPKHSSSLPPLLTFAV